jgi:hypothetical protein
MSILWRSGVVREMRLMLAAVLATFGLATGWPAQAFPIDCPPNCDRIPDSAWIEPNAIPLFPVYLWPRLAAVAVTATEPRFRFEEACGTPPIVDDARRYAVAARAVVPQPASQWQLQVQVIHWRGETWRGGETATAVFDAAVAALRSCQLTAPLTSPSITTDSPDRMAAVISGSIPGQPVLHEYLLVHPRSSTLAEVALWAPAPPVVGWPVVPDAQVLDAMKAPLCRAYIDSCR